MTPSLTAIPNRMPLEFVWPVTGNDPVPEGRPQIEILHRLQPDQPAGTVGGARCFDGVGESLALGQCGTDVFFERVVYPLLREQFIPDPARNRPAVQPGQRAFIGDDIADVGARLAQLLDL